MMAFSSFGQELGQVKIGILSPKGKKKPKKSLQSSPRQNIKPTTSWWFQPIARILVELDHFPK